MSEKYKCPDCTREVTKEEFEIIKSIVDTDYYCWCLLAEEIVALRKKIKVLKKENER